MPGTHWSLRLADRSRHVRQLPPLPTLGFSPSSRNKKDRPGILLCWALTEDRDCRAHAGLTPVQLHWEPWVFIDFTDEYIKINQQQIPAFQKSV